MKKGKLEKVVQTGLKIVGVGAAAVALAIGLSGCPEPKTEYRTRVVCDDPTHGEHCPDDCDQESIEEHKCGDHCSHEIPKCEYKTVTACYTATTNALKAVRAELDCESVGCINDIKCDNGVISRFTNSVFDSAINAGRSLHDINNIWKNNGQLNAVYTRIYDSNRSDDVFYGPCINVLERENAQQAARAGIGTGHTF